MNPIHDNTGNLIAVEMHQTRYSSEALAQMAATCERYRVALETIAQTLVCDPATFAQAILDGKSRHEALTADVEAMLAPVTPEVAQSILRIDARRELVRAALRLHSDPSTMTKARARELFAACERFLATGGNEVEG